MRKFLFIAGTLLLFSCNQTKVAYIDVAELMKGYDATIALEAELLAIHEAKSKVLDSICAPFHQRVLE